RAVDCVPAIWLAPPERGLPEVLHAPCDLEWFPSPLTGELPGLPLASDDRGEEDTSQPAECRHRQPAEAAARRRRDGRGGRARPHQQRLRIRAWALRHD